MKVDWEKIKNGLRWRNVKKNIFEFLEKRAGLILFFLVFILASYGSYLWCVHIYHPQWSEEKKKQYKEEKGKGTDLNKRDFERALENYNLRGNNFNKQSGELSDIFRIK